VIHDPIRTAVDIQVGSFGAFLGSLCHEFSHCLDHRRFGFSGEVKRLSRPR